MSLSTSFALSQAVNDSMTDESVKMSAFALTEIYQELDREQFQDFLFQFAANLTAVTASAVTHVFMTEQQVTDMVAEAVELTTLTNSIENE